MWCNCCERERPATEFLPFRKSGWKVVFCDSCASANMAKWERSRVWAAGKSAEDVNRVAFAEASR